MIQLPRNIDLVKFVQKVYELSQPRGYGHLHFQSGGLSEEEATAEVARCSKGSLTLSMDYVRGRGCKMSVYRQLDGSLSIRIPWYDHTDEQLADLLGTFGIEPSNGIAHSPSCCCTVCDPNKIK